MKSVQIPYDLFIDLAMYHLRGEDDFVYCSCHCDPPLYCFTVLYITLLGTYIKSDSDKNTVLLEAAFHGREFPGCAADILTDLPALMERIQKRQQSLIPNEPFCCPRSIFWSSISDFCFHSFQTSFHSTRR